MTKNPIRLTDKDIYQIVKNVIEEISTTYKPPIVLKEYYADNRQKCIAKILAQFPMAISHWILVIYSLIICFEDAPIQHWKKEIGNFTKEMMPTSVLGINNEQGWYKVIQTALQKIGVDLSNITIETINQLSREKFFEDFPQADEETYLYACSQMLNYFSSYVDCLARQNYDEAMELFNQTLEDYGYEEKNWNKR